MSDDVIREHKLVEAIHPTSGDGATPAPGGKPAPTHATVAEQQREAEEGQAAHNSEGGVRDRLVDIGKANHMGGHSTGRHGDR